MFLEAPERVCPLNPPPSLLLLSEIAMPHGSHSKPPAGEIGIPKGGAIEVYSELHNKLKQLGFGGHKSICSTFRGAIASIRLQFCLFPHMRPLFVSVSRWEVHLCVRETVQMGDDDAVAMRSSPCNHLLQQPQRSRRR